MIQELLLLNSFEWNFILESAVACGELLYLPKKSETSKSFDRDKGQILFQAFCEAWPKSVYSKFVVQCRPFKRTNLEAASGLQDESAFPKLFCLDLTKC
jgi:hypothetical protein